MRVGAAERARLEELANRAAYGGNPQHKLNPGDFGLSPPGFRARARPYVMKRRFLRAAMHSPYCAAGFGEGL